MASIMIVDDSLFMRTVLGNILRKGGHQIIGEANNGKEAIDKYKELKPDIVTMDITMEQMDGLQATAEIKKINPQSKIIICSSMGNQFKVMEAIRVGASDFLVKPLNESKVLEAVTKALA